MEFRKKQTPEIKITPKEKTELHPEFLSKVFEIKGIKFPFTHQNTPANCGPLAIVNGSRTLQSANQKFVLPKDFPSSSWAIRELLANEQSLRTTIWGTRASDLIKQDSTALETDHIANLIKKLASESNIKIIGDRFSSDSGFRVSEIDEKIQNSDWLVCHKGFHYTSFVRVNKDEWISLDSMSNHPTVVTQKYIQDNYKEASLKDTPARFIAIKVEDKPKITIVKKQ